MPKIMLQETYYLNQEIWITPFYVDKAFSLNYAYQANTGPMQKGYAQYTEQLSLQKNATTNF